MGKIKTWLGKGAVMTAIGAVSVSATVSADALEDLNAILEKQQAAAQTNPVGEMLGWDEMTAAMKEGGAKVGLNLTLPEYLLADMDMPEQLQGDLGLTAETTIDLTEKQWLFKLAALADSDTIADLSLYGDENELALSIPQFLSQAVALKSGSFTEQYSGSVWEELLGELSLPEGLEDINLTFFPSGESSTADETGLMDSLTALSEQLHASAEKAARVETREDEAYPGVVFYDAVYETDVIFDLYRDLLNGVVQTMESYGAPSDEMDAMMAEAEEALENGKEILGEEFTVTYWVEEEQMTKLTMQLKMEDSTETEAAEGETEEAEEPEVIIMDMTCAFTDPTNVLAGLAVDIDVYEEGYEESKVHVDYDVINECTDDQMDLSASMKVTEGEDTYLDAEFFALTYHGETGEVTMKISAPAEESGEESGMTLHGVFENVEAGSSFLFTVDDLSMITEGEEISGFTGYVSVDVDFDKVEVPAEVSMLAEMDETDIMGLVMELQMNAQQWMETWGLAEPETEGADEDLMVLPETSEEFPVEDGEPETSEAE